MGDKNDMYNTQYNDGHLTELIRVNNVINNLLEDIGGDYTNFDKHALSTPSCSDKTEEATESEEKPECNDDRVVKYNKDEKLPIYNREEYYDKNSQAYKDLCLVISQTDAEKEKAIDALMGNYGDIVNAIMDLTL